MSLYPLTIQEKAAESSAGANSTASDDDPMIVNPVSYTYCNPSSVIVELERQRGAFAQSGKISNEPSHAASVRSGLSQVSRFD